MMIMITIIPYCRLFILSHFIKIKMADPEKAETKPEQEDCEMAVDDVCISLRLLLGI